MSLKIEPLALTGLLIYLVLIPLIGIVMGNVVSIQK